MKRPDLWAALMAEADPSTAADMFPAWWNEQTGGDERDMAFMAGVDWARRRGLESKIAAFARLLNDRQTARCDLTAAELELRQAIVAAAMPVLPALSQGRLGNTTYVVVRPGKDGGPPTLLLDNGTFSGPPEPVSPIDLAEVLAYLIDRQMYGNLPARVDELRWHATVFRGLAGILNGLVVGQVAKKSGRQAKT